MRRRTKANVSVENLLSTICAVDERAVNWHSIDTISPESCAVSGRLMAAHVEKVSEAKDEKFIPVWIELRQDALIFSLTEDSKGSRKVKFPTMKVTFATRVSPPAPTLLTSPEMKNVAGKLLTRYYLAVYGHASHRCVWIAYNDRHELQRWQQVNKPSPCATCTTPFTFSLS